jgi:hypothetical protein
MFVKFVPAQSGICGFEFIQRVQSLWFFNKGGVIMQDTELQRKYRVSRFFYISIDKPYLIFEGGLLCLEK